MLDFEIRNRRFEIPHDKESGLQMYKDPNKLPIKKHTPCILLLFVFVFQQLSSCFFFFLIINFNVWVKIL